MVVAMVVTMVVTIWLWKTAKKEKQMKYSVRSMRRRRNTDQWELRLLHKDPLTGEQVTTYHTITAKTPKQAEKAADEMIISMETNGYALYTSITVAEFMEAFLAYKEASKTIEPSTLKGYRTEVRQMCKYIGAEKLGELSIPDINEWLAQMTADGYAPKTISKVFMLLKQGLDYAVAQDLIGRNPCHHCKPPKRAKTPINALSRAERSRMLDIARQSHPTPLSFAIEIALTTGMRRGEVCGLRWSDLKDDRTITVSRALGNGEGGFYEKEPKTGHKRIIPLTQQTYHALSIYKYESLKLLASLGHLDADPYILGTQEPDSRPYNPTQLGKDFTAFCKMNGFKCTFHDLRHTFATMAIANGVDVRTVASYLGHSSVSMTLDIYADVDPEAKFSAVSKIENAFDDTMSRAIREDTRRRSAQSLNMPAEAIPFTADQLKTMLAIVENAEPATRY